jgi:hypothetical protein
MELRDALALLGLLVAIAVPLLARRDILTRLTVHDEGRDEWRREVAARLNALEDRKQSNDFAAMQAMDKQREAAWWDWRRSVDQTLDRLGNIPYRVEQLEKRHSEYKDWKHERADPYINDYTSLEQRIRRIENVLNGRLK